MIGTQILWSVLLAAITVALHSLYTIRIVNDLKAQAVKLSPRLRYSLLIEALVLLLLLHCLEAACWAWFYVWQNGMPDFDTALYFSMVSYATIGYGDIVLPAHLRLVGAIEGMVGTLMFGWTAALLIAIVQAIVRGQNSRK